MAETRRSAQEVLERRKNAKESGTYTHGTTGIKRSGQDALQRRERAKESGNYKEYKAPEITYEQAKAQYEQHKKNRIESKERELARDPRHRAEQNVIKKHGTYEEMFGNVQTTLLKNQSTQSKMEEMNRAFYEKLITDEMERLTTDSLFYGKTNKAYQEWLDNFKENATEQKQLDWLDEQKKNLDAMSDTEVRRNLEIIAPFYKNGMSALMNVGHAGEFKGAVQNLVEMGYDADAIESMIKTKNREDNAQQNANFEKHAEELAKGSLGEKIGGHLLSMGSGFLGGMAAFENLERTINEKVFDEYEPTDTNSYLYTSGDFKNNVRAGIEKEITGEEEYAAKGKEVPWWKTGLGMAYQGGASLLDSLLYSGAGGKGVSMALMGLEAASSTSKDTFERTGSNAQATATGAAAGAIEAATEKVSLDNLWDVLKGSGKAMTRKQLVNVLAQAGIEGTEEMTSEGLNTLVDQLINQEDSNYELNVQSYMEEGYSEEDARDMAFADAWKQIGEAGLVGAMSGSMGGGIGAAANTTRTYVAGNQVTKGETIEEVLHQAGRYEDARVKKAVEQYQKNPSDYAIGKILYEMNAVDEIQRNLEEKANKGSVFQKVKEKVLNGQNTRPQKSDVYQDPVDVETHMKQMGEASTAEELVDHLRSVEQNGTPEQIADARNYYDYRSARLIAGGQVSEAEFRKAEEQLPEQDAYELGRKNTKVQPEQLSVKGRIAYNEGLQEYHLEQVKKHTITDKKVVTKAEATDAEGKTIVVDDIVSVEGEPAVRTNSGTVKLSEVTFSNTAVQTLYNNASTQGTTAAAKTYIQYYPAGVTVKSYDEQFDSVVRAGEMGRSFESVLKQKKIFEKHVGKEGLRAIYDIGSQKRMQREAKKSDSTTVKRKGEGMVVDKRLSKSEDPLVRLYGKIAEKTGIDIELHDKDMEGVNGYFERSMSRIVLNTEENTFTSIMHELGEFAESWNQEGMKQFQDALLDWYFDNYKESGLNTIIQQYQEVYAGKEGSKGLREAANEMMNDALSGLFGTETGVQQFTEWLYDNKSQKEAKSIVQTILDFIQDLCDAIRTYISNHELSGAAQATMKMQEEHAGKLRQQFLDAVDKAKDTYKQAEVQKESEAKSKKQRHSLKIKQMAEQFASDYDTWDKTNPAKVFEVSVTSDELKSIGIDDKIITMDSSKLIKIRSQHKGMTDAVIKKIPSVINEPMLILESKTKPSRIVMLGELVDANGKTVLAILELNPMNRKGIVLDEIKIASAYGKDNLQNFVDSSKILYTNPDSEKTSSWLTSTRLQLPVESLTTGSMDSIPSTNNVVNNDLKYSLSGTDDLSDFWESYDRFDGIIGSSAYVVKEAAELLHGKEVDESLVRKIAKQMKQEYSSEIDEDVFADNLGKVFSYMHTQQEVNYEDMVRVMNEVTAPVLEESTEYNPLEDYEYREFKKKLKTIKIRLSDQQKEEVARYYGSYENFRRRMFGTLNLSDSGEYLDNVWEEIVEQSNGYLETEVESEEQPLILVETLEIMKPKFKNNYGADNHGVALDMSLRVFEEYFKGQTNGNIKRLQRAMVHERAQWRDKVRKEYYQKLAEEKQNMKAKTGTINQRVAEVRAAFTASELEKTRKKEATKYRNRIKKTGAELIQWMEKPTDKKHVPESLQKITLEFLRAIDFVSHRAEEDSKMTKRWQERMNWVAATLSQAVNQEKIDDLSSFLMDLDPDFVPALKEFIDKNDEVSKISLMNHTQLKELDKLVESLKRAISKANELHVNKNYKFVSDAANNTIQELGKKKDKRAHSKPVEMADKILNIDMIEPLTYFEMLGEGAKSIYSGIREGFDKRVWHIKEAQDYMKDVLKDVEQKELNKWTGDNAEVHEFKVHNGTRTLRLTTGQIMSLYLLGKRNQARKHILQGGVVASSVKSGSKRIIQAKPLHLSEMQYQKIIDALTPQQKAVADKMQRFLAENCAAWGNETSMQMYGYKKFQDNRYFPIKSWGGQIATNDKTSSEASLWAIKNQGMTKSLVKEAKNAIMAEDIMDVFTNHVVGMANYNAFAASLSDAMKWYNYKNDGMVGEFYEADTVQEEITRAYSKKANDYFVRLIKDVNGEVTNSTSAEFSEMLLSHYKSAAVGANLRVAIQQPTAYARAALILNPVDMLAGFAHAPKIKMAKDNSAIALWKSWGYYETSMGQSMKKVITGQQTKSEWIKDKAGTLAQFGDEVTWGYLWNACEHEIKRTNKGIDVKSEEFIRKVTERFNDVIDQTQVVDTVLHKSQIMRSKNVFAKMEMSFMSEPQKSYNMLYRGFKHGKKEFGKAVLVWAFTGVLTSMAAALMDAVRDDEDYERSFGDKWLEAARANMKDNLNPLAMVPYAKDIISFLNGYDTERSDMVGISNAVKTFEEIRKYISGDSKKTTYGVLKSAARAGSQITGIPMYNIVRDAEALVETFLQENVAEKQATTGDLYEILIEYADSDSEKFNEAYNELLEEKGKEKKEIRSGVRSKTNEMFKKGSISAEEAKEILREWGYDDTHKIIAQWKENMAK